MVFTNHEYRILYISFSITTSAAKYYHYEKKLAIFAESIKTIYFYIKRVTLAIENTVLSISWFFDLMVHQNNRRKGEGNP